MQSKLAIGGVFAATAAAVVGLAIAFGGNAPQDQPIQPAGDVVQVQSTTTTGSAPTTVAAIEAPSTTTAIQAAPVQPKPAPKGQTGGVQNNEPATTPPPPGVPYDSDGHEVIPNPPGMGPGEVAPKPPAPEPTPPAPPIPTG